MKNCVDSALDESTLTRNFKNSGFNNHSLVKKSQITLNLDPTFDNHATSNGSVDSLFGNE